MKQSKAESQNQWIMRRLGVRKIPTPIGPIIAEASEIGLTRLQWCDIPLTQSKTGSKHLDYAEKWVKAYFLGQETTKPSLDYSGLTEFQKSILLTLQNTVPFGKKTTYGELAKTAKRAGASRAVGSTMAKNPWTILVPCHRVVKSDGSLGNYSAADGVKTKSWLLNHEQRLLN